MVVASGHGRCTIPQASAVVSIHARDVHPFGRLVAKQTVVVIVVLLLPPGFGQALGKPLPELYLRCPAALIPLPQVPLPSYDCAAVAFVEGIVVVRWVQLDIRSTPKGIVDASFSRPVGHEVAHTLLTVPGSPTSAGECRQFQHNHLVRVGIPLELSVPADVVLLKKLEGAEFHDIGQVSVTSSRAAYVSSMDLATARR